MAELPILLNSIKKNEKWLIELRRELHECAEGGFELKRTKEIIERELKNIGIEPHTIAKCGVCATLGRGEKCILLRADSDAIRLKEESELPYSATSEFSHACGHDMHTAMLLGAAKLLKENEVLLTQRVKLLFQPAEELLEGAEAAVEDGILENPKVDSALSLHVICPAALDTGTVIIPDAGVGAPAADFFDINIYGTPSHGAASQLSADASAVGARILLSLEELVAKESPPLYASAVTIGSVHSGAAANIISDKCSLAGTLRTLDLGERERLRSRIVEISEGTAEIFGARAEVKFHGGAPTLLNDEYLSEAAYSVLSAEIPTIRVEEMDSTARASLGGSEDFATFSHRVPSLLIGIAAGLAEEGFAFPLHHPRVVFDERALVFGSVAYAKIALEVK